jgi:hypothetical protein
MAAEVGGQWGQGAATGSTPVGPAEQKVKKGIAKSEADIVSSRDLSYLVNLTP